MGPSNSDNLAVDALGLLVGTSESAPTLQAFQSKCRASLLPIDDGGTASFKQTTEQMQRLVSLLARLNAQTDGHVSEFLEDLTTNLDTPPSETERLLPAEEIKALRASGSFVEQTPEPSRRGSTLAAVRRQRLRCEALSVAEVRRLLGVSDSRIRQRIAARTLHALADVGQGRRFPAYQFTDSGELPEWKVVAPVFPADVDLISAEHVMTTAHPDLSVDGEPASPRAWLLEERPVDQVVDLVRHVYEIP